MEVVETVLPSGRSRAGRLSAWKPELPKARMPASESLCQFAGSGGDQELNVLMKPWYLVVETARTSPKAGVIKGC